MPLSFLIRRSWDQRPFAGFPRLIAGYRVLRRLSMPRHPPCTLNSLTTVTDHRHSRLGITSAVHTAGQRIRSTSRGIRPAAPVLPERWCYPTRQKGARRPPDRKRKRPCPPPTAQERDRWETKRREVADSARPPPGGG